MRSRALARSSPRSTSKALGAVGPKPPTKAWAAASVRVARSRYRCSQIPPGRRPGEGRLSESASDVGDNRWAPRNRWFLRVLTCRRVISARPDVVLRRRRGLGANLIEPTARRGYLADLRTGLGRECHRGLHSLDSQSHENDFPLTSTSRLDARERSRESCRPRP